MLSSINPRIRIGIVLIISFFVSGFVMKYAQESPSEMAPQIQIQTIASDFSQSLSNSGTSILSALQSFKLPTLVSFVPPSEPQPIEQPIEPTPADWETGPTDPSEIPTSTPAILPTNGPIPTNITIPTMRPTIHVVTQPPQPTKAPKPTKVPKPTEVVYPPVNDDVRPGTSIEEILREVSKRACIPYALLMATRTQESGAWMQNLSASTAKMYNTYGWWKGADKGSVCAALAYYTQSGLIPPDSGGGSCTNGVQPGAYDQKIMGLMQMSEQEEQVTRKNTIKVLPKNIDRRVLFDNAVIYAFATKGRAGNSPQPSCDDWPEETIRVVAEKHFGACAYGGGKNYCTEVWNLYKSFK